MFNVSDNYKNAILSDVRDMPYRVTLAGGVTLTQDDIPNMSLTESMGDTNSLAIGSANAAELNLTLRNPAGVDYNNMLVEPESGLVLEDGSIEWIPLGKFWVTNVSTSNDYKTVKLSCIDGMYLLSGDYVSELTYPTTLKAVVKEIVSQSGVEFVEPEVWPDIVVRVKPEGMTYRNAIGYAAGCMGCNARFNRDGKLELVWYSGSGVTIERNTQYLNGMTKLHDKPLTVYVEVTGAQEKYEVTIISDNNGRVSASPSRNVLEGDLVSLSVRPNNKYELSAISAVDANGVAVTLSADAEGAGYTFTQPDSNVTVTAAFRSTAGGPYKLTVRSSGNGTLTCQGSGLEAGDNYFNAGDEVYIAPSPNSGYEFNNFYTTPAGIEIVQDSRFWYLFTMPESDVTVTANFREAITFNVNRYWGSGEGYISATNETTNGNTFHEGDLVNVYIAPATGYAFDYYECSVEMTQIDEYNYQFIMPAETVNITVYFKFADDESKTDTLSFLQHPSRALPPTTKPYWAVFYKYDEYVGSNARYYLVWFDSWSESNGSITMNGYYYCRGSNNGYFAHTWDNSSWSGSGASGSSITWDSLLGKRGEDDYCLLASNVHLYSSYGSIAFEKCESAISQTQGSRLLNGADIRDAGVFAKYPCPDTYSTPLPAANWMVVYYPEINKESEDGSSRETLFPGTYYNYALYFDSVSVTDVGQWFDKDYNCYKLSFPNGVTIVTLLPNGEFGSVYEINEACYTLIADPNYVCDRVGVIYSMGYVGGMVATNLSLSEGGLWFEKNSPIICDCEPVSTFSLRRNTIVTDPVTLSYTNPMIYEKMVPAVNNTVVQGLTYTPAKLKHRGNPALQAGDIVTVPDGDGVYHNVLIMQQTMNFGGGMNSEISCPGQTAEVRKFTSNSPSTAKIKEEVALSTADIERRISENNAYVFSSIYRSLENTKNSLNEQINDVNSSLYSALETVQKYEDRLHLCEKGISNLNAKTTDIEEAISYIEQDIFEIKNAAEVLEKAVTTNQADIDSLEQSVSGLEARLTALEDGTELGALKKELASTDAKIAYCSEVFMLEVMVNGTAPADVVLPYNISELHNTREELRAQIADLEV